MAGHNWKADGAGAYALLQLAHKQAAWVTRHTDIVRFDGGASVDRCTILEFGDDGFSDWLPDCNGRTPIPLLALKRWPALHVSVTHEGKPVPLLLRREEREIIAAALAAEAIAKSPEAAKYAADHGLPPSQLRDDLTDEILFTIEPDLAVRPTFLEERPSIVGEIPNLTQMCAIYLDARIVVSLPPTDVVGASHTCLVERHAEKVDLRRGSIAAAYAVWTNQTNPDLSMYARWMRGAEDVERRSLVLSDGSAMRIQRHSGIDGESIFKRAWAWPFLVPDTYLVDLKVASFLECESFHFEATVPPGCYLERTRFRVLTAGTDEDGPWTEMVIVDDDDHHPDRAHIHFNRMLSSTGATAAEYDPDSTVRLALRPTYHDGLRAGMHLSWLSSLLLAFLAGSIGWTHAGWDPLVTWAPVGRPDANSIVALLLLGPTFALTLAARPDEHHLTKRVHARSRARLLTTAVVVFISSLAIAIDFSGAMLFWVLAGAATIAAALASASATSALYSRARIRAMEDLTDAGTVTIGT